MLNVDPSREPQRTMGCRASAGSTPGPALKHLRERPAAGPFYANEILDDGLRGLRVRCFFQVSKKNLASASPAAVSADGQATDGPAAMTGTAQLMFRITMESGSRKAQCNKAPHINTIPGYLVIVFAVVFLL